MKLKMVILGLVMSVAVLSAAEVNIMTFNIRMGTANDGSDKWSLRKELVFEVIRNHDPDVIGLQEAFKFQIDEIRAAVPGYELIGQGREGDEKGEYSAILYKKKRFECMVSDTFWLSDTPKIPSKTWGNTCIRICTWARLLDRSSKRAIYVYNTHLDHQSQPSREKSVRLIVERMAAREHKDLLVLTGDFNMAEDNPAILYMKGLSADEKTPLPMADSYRMLHPDEKTVGTFNGFKGVSDGAKIDYVFVSPKTKVSHAQIIRSSKNGRFPSDHYPVTAKLQF